MAYRKPTPKKKPVRALVKKGDSADANPTGLLTLSKNGEAPDCRIQCVSQAHTLCKEMVDADDGRSNKRARLYRSFKRFPPTEYSSLVEINREGQSNVNWGMMAFIVNNHQGSFYDMISERHMACDIITTHGAKEDQPKWSELISWGYDRFAVREDDDYLFHVEADILSMMLYGKGIQFYEAQEGFQSEPCAVEDFYVPEQTKLTLSKVPYFMRRRKYTLGELYDIIRDQEVADQRGWNVPAVVEAMRIARTDWREQYRNAEDFYREVKSGAMSVSSLTKEHVFVFDLYMREFDGHWSRTVILQDYNNILVNETKDSAREEKMEGMTEDEKDECGFLFHKDKFAESHTSIVSVFIDRAGSTLWHDTPSLAEEVFVQCREYDIIMNNIADAIKINMTLLLQGQSEEANDRLKQIVWGGHQILPSATPFVQQRAQLDTSNATQSLQYMMSDLYSGIGSYQIQKSTPGGDKPTATQTNFDASESAKLKGTQISRYNNSQTRFHRERARRFFTLTDGEEGYEFYRRFKKSMKSLGVPPEAWKWENIETVTSNMVAGAGSPAYRLMAAEKILGWTNIVPKDPGQRAALEDAIAAVAGRGNVSRYIVGEEPKLPGGEDLLIGLQNEAFENQYLNPQNIPVLPTDDHFKHVPSHLNDMANTINRVEQAIGQKKIDKEQAMSALTRLGNGGAHVTRHIQFVSQDKSKEAYIKEWTPQLAMMQQAVSKIQQNLQAMKDEQDQANGFNAAGDPDIQKALAMAQIQVETAQKMADIKLQQAVMHATAKDDINKDKAKTDIAINIAKAAASKAKPAAKPPAK